MIVRWGILGNEINTDDTMNKGLINKGNLKGEIG